ncbi:MAG: hypothetical protein HZB40_16710 [Rhodocyclales bacterium]|nr:hypothetical protein [Rhodocyclales bacterium]
MCEPISAAAAAAATETAAMSAWAALPAAAEAFALPAWAGTAMQAGSLAMQVVGSMNQAEQQRSAYEYQSQVARNNAIIAEQNARLAQEQGAQDEQNQRLKVASFYSDQRAQLAANGIDLGVGSAADLLATTKFMGEHDALTIRDNAARRAWAYRAQSQDFTSDASFKSAAGSNINPFMAGASSFMTGAGSMLTSAGGVANKWKFNRT